MMLKPHHSAAGFSLIELLVVLLLMGLASGFVMLSLNTDSALEVNRRAAERFSLLAKLAVDEAILSGDTLGLMIRVSRPSPDSGGEPRPSQYSQAQSQSNSQTQPQFQQQANVQYQYQWRRYRDEQWSPIGDHLPVENFPAGSEVLIDVDGERLDWSEVTSRTSVAPNPVALVYASGEATQVNLLLPITREATSWQQVTLSAAGQVSWVDASRIDPSLTSSTGPSPW